VSIKDDALYTVAIKALADFAKERLDEVRALMLDELVTFYDETGAKSVDVRLPDGTKVASIPLSFARDGFTVSLEDEFVAHVETVCPMAVRKVVDSTWQRTYLASLQSTPDGTVIDPATGEVVPGVAFVAGGAIKTYSVRWDGDGRDSTIAALRSGAIPGVLDASEIPALPDTDQEA
jgi:hypothetical protein